MAEGWRLILEARLVIVGLFLEFIYLITHWLSF